MDFVRESFSATPWGRDGMPQTPETDMWQSVILKALLDATQTTDRYNQRVSDAWFRSRCFNFKFVCTMAGMDPEFIADAYENDRFDREILKAASKLGGGHV